MPRPRAYCTVPDCSLPRHGGGLCSTHYARWLKHGDPNTRLKQRDTGPDESRWMGKVSVESPGCWLWTAGDDGQGYGAYSAGGKNVRAHRYVYQLLVGAIPEGMDLDHLCRRRRCCNPDHLEPVPPMVNRARGARGPGKERPKL